MGVFRVVVFRVITVVVCSGCRSCCQFSSRQWQVRTAVEPPSGFYGVLPGVNGLGGKGLNGAGDGALSLLYHPNDPFTSIIPTSQRWLRSYPIHYCYIIIISHWIVTTSRSMSTRYFLTQSLRISSGGQGGGFAGELHGARLFISSFSLCFCLYRSIIALFVWAFLPHFFFFLFFCIGCISPSILFSVSLLIVCMSPLISQSSVCITSPFIVYQPSTC